MERSAWNLTRFYGRFWAPNYYRTYLEAAGEPPRPNSVQAEVSPAQATQAQTMARRIVQGEAAWAWDGAVVDTTGNEVDIFHAGELLRLDRLVRRADTGEWWVLDFKSAENPALQPDLLTKMQRYRQAVQSARPGATVRLAFINLHGRLIELQDPSITS